MLSGRGEAGNPQRAASVVQLEKRNTGEADDPTGIAGLRRRRVGRADDEAVRFGKDPLHGTVLAREGPGEKAAAGAMIEAGA